MVCIMSSNASSNSQTGVGAVREPPLPPSTNPTLSLHKRKIRADSRNKCMYREPVRRLFSNRSR